MKRTLTILILITLFIPVISFSQTTVNVYARVTAISGNTLTVSNTTGSFTTGQAIVMQMQDSTIGTNTGNNTGFGNLGSIQSAGIFEVVTITAATSTSITLSGSLVKTYHVNNNSRVQIISYPTFGGGGNYTLSSAVTAAAWNGNTGGVVAFRVNGTLTINNNITVNGQGFRGGAAGTNAPGDFACDPNTYFDNAGSVSTTYYGYKGEGIYNSNGAYTVARGKLLNGGGGGNLNNGGGGGGGNLTAGGTGGQGWTCTAATTGGGIGGIDLSTYISSSRFFPGGGGGGGQQNNNVGSAGGNGGGIIMIKANVIKTASGCNSGAGSVSISAAGQQSANSGNDGAGGGGAGGTILLDAPSYNINNGCPINMNASGGNGGTVNDAGAHGGGAGGGKGAVIFAGIVGIPANINVTDTAGTGGGNANTSGAATAGGGATVSGSGNTTGVIYTPSSALPVQLISFTAAADKNNALLQWKTSEETGFAYYQVERSLDNAVSYSAVGKVQATGNNSSYHYTDNLGAVNATGSVYYRLKMVDKNGDFKYSDVRVISFTQQDKNMVRAFPNPAIATVNIYMGNTNTAEKFTAGIHDMQGRMVKYFSSVAVQQDKTITLSLNGIAAGQYIVTINGNMIQQHAVITKQ
jgi:Secretion system C-terminal sorting domain